MVQRLSMCALVLLLASCGSSQGGGGATPPGDNDPGVIKKVSLAWGLTPIGGSADVFLAITDEKGRATSHPLGRFEGACTVIDAGRPSTGALTAVLCKHGDVGVELDAIPRPGVIIVLKIPYVEGAEPDPLSGEEVAHINVPIGAKIETAR